MAPVAMATRTASGATGQKLFSGAQLGRPEHISGSSRTPRLVITAAQSPMRMKDMSRQMQDMRSRMEEDENVKILMAGLRGSNMSNADFADSEVVMRLVEIVDNDSTDRLPLVYDPARIGDYWGRRPVAVATRIMQLLGISWGFLSKLGWDLLNNKLQETEVARAIELRNIVTSLGPAYIKLGQALSIRPDILSPAAMNELQKLCDKVPSFDSKIAMQLIEDELGRPWFEVYAELSPEPIAAASLGQVYKGRLKSGEEVAVKVQRPYVLETVTVDLFIIRKLGVFLKRFPQLKTDVVALLDEWAARFFEELDYVHEGRNGTRFAESIAKDLPQVVVPKTYEAYTARRVLTTGWLEGEKLSQSAEDDVGTLVNVGVICYLKQLLDTGFFHADPHPGNLIRTPDGRLAILDFGLMTQIDDNIKFGMIEAISHLIHRDYEAIVEDFVTLDFIPPGTDLRPILPVLAKVFDQALAGGGAKSINFQELAADLAQITFDYPFRIPPYFALIIRAISVLEGIALVGDANFAIVDEAYPYVAKRLLTDDSPRLREALRYMVYGKESVFDADRLIDLLDAFESFSVASKSARGDMDVVPAPSDNRTFQMPASTSTMPTGTSGWSSLGLLDPFAAPVWGLLQIPAPLVQAPAALLSSMMAPPRPQTAGSAAAAPGTNASVHMDSNAREALKFMFSPEGSFFREFLLDEMVKSIDALTRAQLQQVVVRLGLEGAMLPVLLPGANRAFVALGAPITAEDRRVVDNLVRIADFLSGGSMTGALAAGNPQLLNELLPYLPNVATEIVPQLSERLVSRITARALREFYANHP